MPKISILLAPWSLIANGLPVDFKSNCTLKNHLGEVMEYPVV